MQNVAGKSSFVYATYVRSTPEKVWDALTNSKSTAKYWFGRRIESSWEAGASVLFYAADGRLTDQGEILRCEKGKALSYTWRVESDAALRAEGESRVTFTLETVRDVVKLTLAHEELAPGGRVEAGIREGWPAILSGLKSLIETGRALGFDSPERA